MEKPKPSQSIKRPQGGGPAPAARSSRVEAIRSRLSQTLLKDRDRLEKSLDRLMHGARGKKPNQRFLNRLEHLENRLTLAIQRKEERLKNRPTLCYPEGLPILDKRQEIVEALQTHQVVIISGDTGSGKSTQIPKMCIEAGQGMAGKIGCTQPRRIAATTIARRIAEELEENVGQSVGYKIRFTDRSHPNTFIKIMTDGMLLAETQKDRFLYEYDTLIIDEAHERSLNIDFLLGILRSLLPKRRELKVVITSATLDTEKFSRAFQDASVIHVEGRMYPVEVRYEPGKPSAHGAEEETHVDLAVRAIEDIRKKDPPGDVLIFMPTEQDIRETCELLATRTFKDAIILPLFARLTAAQQKRVFSSVAGLKIVVATNVAETSLTIPGIRYVIDTGLARIPRYLPRTRTLSLAVAPISRSSADQRKGRCGRIGRGTCIRLYSEEDYEARAEYTPPEIMRSNLAEVILRMLSLNLGHIDAFPFIDKPHQKSIKDGFDLLKELGAITKRGRIVALTPMGKLMARMPLDPRVSRMMLEAQKEGCVEEVSVIASALSIQDPRDRPYEKARQADRAHGPFKNPDSDFLSLLKIWNAYQRAWQTHKTQNRMRKFSREHFLSFVRMREWRDIHDQIHMILKENRTPPLAVTNEESELSRERYAAVHRSILSGYLSNIAMKKDRNLYLAARGREVMLFPGSTLFNKGVSWVVAAEMVKTTRLFARTAARIDPEWLESLGGGLCKRSYSDAHWERNRGEVRAAEHVTLFGLRIVSGRPVSYGPIRPEEAQGIFIQSALVEGLVNEKLPFLDRNRHLIETLAGMEDKIRRHDLLVAETVLADFYSERLPGICDIRSLKSRIKDRGGDAFLNMHEADLVLHPPDPSIPGLYPDQVSLGNVVFPFSYKFSPGHEEDGVTISIPESMLSRFPAHELDWLVPGLFKEKITALVKGLPKRFRKQLVPVSKTVETIVKEMPQAEESLLTSLARFIYRRFRVDIPASAWPIQGIPEHLKMRVSLTDTRGRMLRAGRDIHTLRKGEKPVGGALGHEKKWKAAREKWEKTHLTQWDFGELPEQIPLGPNLAIYPALQPGERCVHLRLFEHADEALQTHRQGVAALFSLILSKDLKFLKRSLKLPEDIGRAAVYFGGARALETALYESSFQRRFHLDIRTGQAFDRHVEEARAGLLKEGLAWRDLAVRVIRAYEETRTVIHTIESANRTHPKVLALCTVIRENVTRLVPENFPHIYGPERMCHLPRYLKALAVRAQRGSQDTEKDREKDRCATVFSRALDRLRAELPPHASGQKKSDMEAFQWMIEEYRVSLFAQELKTPFPVSRKRLQKKLDDIERMV